MGGEVVDDVDCPVVERWVVVAVADCPAVVDVNFWVVDCPVVLDDFCVVVDVTRPVVAEVVDFCVVEDDTFWVVEVNL